MPGGIYSIRNNYTPILKKYITKNDSVLEIGCGTGAITGIIKGLCRELKASDVSKSMLEVAKQKIKGVEFSIADTQELPFNDGTFTVVAGLNTFSYCGDKRKAIGEIKRVLKKGGLFINIDMNYLSPVYYLRRLLYPRSIYIWLPILIESNRFYLSSLFRNYDFNIVEMRELNWIPHAINYRWLKILKPIDRILSKIPVINMFSMRILVVGRKI